MMKIYTPKEWLSSFGGNAALTVADNGDIYAGGDENKLLEGAPIGRIDFEAGRIYGADMGFGPFAEPVALLERKGEVTEVLDARKGVFSAPVLYIRDHKIYTPEQYTSLFDAPSAYIHREDAGQTPAPPADGPHDSGAAGGLGSAALKWGGMLLAFYCVVVGVGSAMPIWLSLLVAAALITGLGYLAFFSKDRSKRRPFQWAFWAVLAWFVLCAFLILPAVA